MTAILTALFVLCKLVSTIISHPAQPLHTLNGESSITSFNGWLNETTLNLQKLSANGSQVTTEATDIVVNEGFIVEITSKPTTKKPKTVQSDESRVIKKPETTTEPIVKSSTVLSMLSEESMISKVDAELLAKVIPEILAIPDEHYVEELKPELRSSGNSVKIKVTNTRKNKGLAAKMMERLRKNKAGKPSNFANMAKRRKLNTVKIYTGDDGKKKNIIVVSNGATSAESDALKSNLLHQFVPIYQPMRQFPQFDDKLEAKAYSMYSQAVPLMPPPPPPPPVGPMPPHRAHHQHPHRWHDDTMPLPPPPSSHEMSNENFRGRRARHILDGSIMHPMTETVHPESEVESMGSSVNGYNDVLDLLRAAILSASSSSNHRDRGSSSLSSDYTTTLEALASKLGLKGFNLLTDSSLGNSFKSLVEPNRYPDWNHNVMTGQGSSDEKLLQLLLDQQSRSSSSFDRLNVGERMNIFGASEYEPSPLTKISQALLGEETLEDTLKKLALFELLNKKQVPLTAQIFEELKHQLQHNLMANQKLHRHTQDVESGLKSSRSKKKIEEEEEDEESENEKSTSKKFESRSRKFRKTLRENLSKLREQREKLRGRLKAS